MSNNPETNNNPEIRGNDIEASAERIEQLMNKAEKSAELIEDAEESAENARSKALESAISVESSSAENKRQNHNSSTKKRKTISKKEKDLSFKKQMNEVHTKQNPVERSFSKIIHNKVIEKTSDIVASTVARPNSILAGSVSAFLVSLVVYIMAKNTGYELSGFETIGSFLVGWIIGIVYDYLRIVVTGKK